MVGNESLLLSIPLRLSKSLRAGISVADSASHLALVACTTLFIRRAALGSQSLAGGDPIYFSRSRCPCVDDAAFHSRARDTLVGGSVDVPVLVHGTYLFSSDNSCHYFAHGIFISK